MNYYKTGGFDNFVEKYIPNFNVVNDKVVFEKYEKVSTPLGITFIFDTKENNVITEEDKKDVDSVIFKVTPDKIISSYLGTSIDIKNMIKIFNIKTKNDIYNIKPIINLSVIISSTAFFTSLILADLISLLISAIFVGAIVNFYKLKFTQKDIFKLTVYINTTAYLLKRVLALFYISVPSFIYLGVVLAYLHYVLKIFMLDTEYKKVDAKN